VILQADGSVGDVLVADGLQAAASPYLHEGTIILPDCDARLQGLKWKVGKKVPVKPGAGTFQHCRISVATSAGGL
jgi:hypothetical protein